MAIPHVLTPARNPFGLFGRSRNYRLFWTGQTMSLMGTWMHSMAQGWLALELTNDPLLVGAVATATSLPILLISLPAGVLVDRVDRLRLLRIMQTGLLAEATLLWWFTATGQIGIWTLLALATLNGAIAAVEIPARNAMMADLVGLDELPDAIALNSAGFNLARIVGPAAAGIVIAQLGIAWCFALNALSYGFVLGGLAMVEMRQRGAGTRRGGSPLRGIAELLVYVRRTRTVRALLELVAVVGVFGVPFLTLMPVMARDRLHLGPGGYGVLLACVGLGGLTGALWLAASRASRDARGNGDGLLMRSAIAFALLLLLFAVARAPWLAQLALLGAGFTMIVNNALAFGMLQHHVPDRLRGRLSSMYSLLVVGVAQVVGSFAAGAVARWAGPHWAIGIGAGVILGFVARCRVGKE